MATVYPDVSVRQLSLLLGVSRDWLTARIRTAKPCGTRRTHPTYALADVLPLLVKPFAADGEVDPDSLSPADRKHWFDSETRRRQLQVTDRELIPAVEVEEVVGRAFAAVAHACFGLPDQLERVAGLNPTQADKAERIIDATMTDLADTLSAFSDADLKGNRDA